MFDIVGQYNTAKVYVASGIEPEAYSQIQDFVNLAVFAGSKIAIMPDVHAGKGVPIGFTATLTEKVIPNVIGVDIGCGVLSHPMFMKEETFRRRAKDFDAYVRATIPMGTNVRDYPYPMDKIKRAAGIYLFMAFHELHRNVKEVSDATNQDYAYVMNSLGTLGGGNHFIEVDKSKEGYLFLTVHSGSRNFGLKVANFHQKLAYNNIVKRDVSKEIEEIKRTKKGKDIENAILALKKAAILSVPRHLAHLEGADKERYIKHMVVAQQYAAVNRRLMIRKMLEFFDIEFDERHLWESTHNYIDVTDSIMRKGAISAHQGEPVLIPLTMKAGVILGKGKGNPDWNYSAPHGAGRKMSRSKARSELKLEDYKKEMDESGIWTSSVSEETLDEAPAAYKDPQEIIDAVKETIEVEHILTPIYNLKAGEERKDD